jgi:phosphoglycerate-specific signal transduction histidine kinase
MMDFIMATIKTTIEAIDLVSSMVAIKDMASSMVAIMHMAVIMPIVPIVRATI